MENRNLLSENQRSTKYSHYVKRTVNCLLVRQL